MVTTKLHVKAVGSSNKVLVEGPVTTMANGFFELWLPRNEKVQLTISGLGKTVTGMLETNDKSKTCLTTYHLQ